MSSYVRERRACLSKYAFHHPCTGAGSKSNITLLFPDTGLDAGLSGRRVSVMHLRHDGGRKVTQPNRTRLLLVVPETFELTWSQAETPEAPQPTAVADSESRRPLWEQQQPNWIMQLIINA